MTFEQLEDIKKEDIKESWYWDILRMEDQVKELQRKIRLAKKERSLQPILVGHSTTTSSFHKIYQYRIIDYDKSQLCAEVKEKMSDEEVQEFKRGLEC